MCPGCPARSDFESRRQSPGFKFGLSLLCPCTCQCCCIHKGCVSVRIIYYFLHYRTNVDIVPRLPGILPRRIGVDGRIVPLNILCPPQVELGLSLNDNDNYAIHMNNNQPRRVYCRDWKSQRRVCPLHYCLHFASK